LRQLLGSFDGKDKDWHDILDLIACSWVDHRSMEKLAALSSGNSAKRNVTLNAEQAQTARLYVVKASGRRPSAAWSTADVADVAADLDDLKTKIEVSLARALRLETSPVDRARLQKKLKNLEDAKDPVVVCLKTNGLDQAWLASLRKSFESVTFFLLSGNDRFTADDVERMEPEIHPEFEVRFWSDYEDCKDALER
jgi:hypothetical protein